MFEFQNVLNVNNNLIQFCKKKKREFLYCVGLGFTEEELVFFEIVLKPRAFSQEISNLHNILIASNLNR